MIEITVWMKEFLQTLNETFANRVWFVGLQGSYGRGEATETSDIACPTGEIATTSTPPTLCLQKLTVLCRFNSFHMPPVANLPKGSIAPKNGGLNLAKKPNCLSMGYLRDILRYLCKVFFPIIPH